MMLVVMEEKERHFLDSCIYLSEQKGTTGEEAIWLLLFTLVVTLPTPSYIFLSTFKSSQRRGEEIAKGENKGGDSSKWVRKAHEQLSIYTTLGKPSTSSPFATTKFFFQMFIR